MSNTQEKIRLLKPKEISIRVERINKSEVSFLLYKDARVDMDILDETYGPMNWKREHSRDNANCVVSIWDDAKKQWIPKEDVGMPSFADADKGLASDSFKRACVNVGIGRELYSAPPIVIARNLLDVRQNFKGKDTCYSDLYVNKIAYDENRTIVALQIKDRDTDKAVFNRKLKNASIAIKYDINDEKVTFTPDSVGDDSNGEMAITEEQKDIIRRLVQEANVQKAVFLKKFEAAALSDLTYSQAVEGIEKLEALKAQKESNVTTEEESPVNATSNAASMQDKVNAFIEAQNDPVEEPAEDNGENKDDKAPVQGEADVKEEALNEALSRIEDSDNKNSEPIEATENNEAPNDVVIDEEYGEVLFECDDDASDNMKAYIGVQVKDLPVAIMKPFTRANSAIAKKVPEEVATAIKNYYETMNNKK